MRLDAGWPTEAGYAFEFEGDVKPSRDVWRPLGRAMTHIRGTDDLLVIVRPLSDVYVSCIRRRTWRGPPPSGAPPFTWESACLADHKGVVEVVVLEVLARPHLVAALQLLADPSKSRYPQEVRA